MAEVHDPEAKQSDSQKNQVQKTESGFDTKTVLRPLSLFL